MNTLRLFLFLFFSLSTFNTFADSVLSEQSVREMMKLVDQASNDRNHKVILSYLTDDAVIISDLPNKIGDTLTMTKEEYKQGLLAAWSLPMQMTYYTRGLKVKLSADKKSATTTQTVLETVVHKGRLLASASTKETSEVVLVNGKPKVRRIEGIVSVK